MALDQYSLCPCGSGKKIKFCKCFDNLQEIVKVDRMIEGEQSVAALDKISQLLKTFPSDAWLYAMKCEVLLGLKEFESLEEASAKFIRLRPDNPLARLYRSLVAIVRRNTEEAASLMLQAMAESSDVMHPLFMTVATNLIEALLQEGKFMSALMHSEILMDIGEQFPEVSQRPHRSVIGLPTSVLVREPPPSPVETEDAAWSERFREAVVLLNRFQIALAKPKLEALIREFGPEPEFLTAQLHCRLMLADQEGAATICFKLADNEKLPDPVRVYFRALGMELNPDQGGISVRSELLEYSLDHIDDLDTKLASNPYLIVNNDDRLRESMKAVAKEEISPKQCYEVAVPVFRDQFPDLKLKRVLGHLAYFGRQTDKPPKMVGVVHQGAFAKTLSEIARDIGLHDPRVLETESVRYGTAVEFAVVIDRGSEVTAQAEVSSCVTQAHIEEFLSTPFNCLGGKTIKDAQSDPERRLTLLALLLHWQASGEHRIDDRQFIALHERLGLVRPKLDPEEDLFDQVGGAAYFWSDLSTIRPPSLLGLIQSAMARNISSILPTFGERSRQIEWPPDAKDAAEYVTLNIELRQTTDLESADTKLEQICKVGKAIGAPIGNAVLERMEVLMALGRRSEAQRFMEQALRESPRDPYLLQFMQMAMYQQAHQQRMQSRDADQIPNAILMHGTQRTPPTPAASNPRMWSPSPAASPPPPSETSSGSKLWIPGQ